jgi:hypothetical protein
MLAELDKPFRGAGGLDKVTIAEHADCLEQATGKQDE